MVSRKFILISLVFLVLISASFVSAAALTNYTNLTSSVEKIFGSVVNFTIGTNVKNISKIVFNITGSINVDPDKFVINSNGSNFADISFTNSTYTTPGFGSSWTVTLIFSNTSTNPAVVPNGTSKLFWFSVIPKNNLGSFVTITAMTYSQDGATSNSSSSVTYDTTFRFSGYVKNETGDLVNGTNVSLYRYIEGQMGPPIEQLTASALSDTSGAFSLSGISATSGKQYTLKMIHYNSSNPNQALKISSSLPAFPAEMFIPRDYGSFSDMPAFEFMKPPSLNGSTFYLGPAATINVSATNGSTSQLFGYMLMEQGTGFPISSNSMGNDSNTKIIVPINRAYTLMAIRAKNQFVHSSVCDGLFMNDTACQSPPVSNSTLNPSIEGQTINVNMDLRISRVQLYGCIAVTGNSTAIINISSILPRMVPWTGFVPPTPADTSSLDLTNKAQMNISDPKCGTKLAWYNISLLNANYLIEFYGKNASLGEYSEYLGAFQNVSLTGQIAGANIHQNITLNRLAGSFVAAASVLETNASKTIIYIQNSSGGMITQDKPHVELQVTHSSFGKLTYVMDSITNGTIKMAFPYDATVKAKIFSNNAPPKEKNLNLSQAVVNITLTTMTDGKSGFKKINATGGFEDLNTSSTSFSMNMRFIKSSTTCDIINPSSTCELTSMTATNFNPMKALVAGKINMEMKLISSNVSLTFYNFDMFAAKQPPMESIMNNQASGGSSSKPTWQFGSFVPADVYDYAVVAMPYSDSNINDSANINISLDGVYDENWNAQINVSRGDTADNLTSSIDDYLGNANNRSYNYTGYRNYLTTAGIACSKTDSNLTGNNPTSYCYVNTSSNFIYMRVPHFSGVTPTVGGSAPSSATTAGTTTGGSSGLPSSFWTREYSPSEIQLTSGYTQALEVKARVKFTLASQEHSVGVIALTNTTATINVSSTPQTATLAIGEEKKFDLTSDNYYDILVKLLGIKNSQANVTIIKINELVPESERTSKTTSTPSGEENQETPTTKSLKSVQFWVIVIIVIVVIILVIAYILHNKRRYYKKGY